MATEDRRSRFGSPTMWTRHAARLIDRLTEVGADRTAMLATSGLSEDQLCDLDGRVPLGAVYDAVESAMDTTDDPLLGVHVAQTVTTSDLDAMGYLMLTSRTLGEAVERLNRFGEVFVTGEVNRWYVSEHGVVRQFVPHGPDRPAHSQVAELVFYHLGCNSRRLFGVDLTPAEIRLRHTRNNRVDYDAVFGCRVVFEQRSYDAYFPNTVLTTPVGAASPTMAPFVDRYLQELLGTVPAEGSLTAMLTETIDRRLEFGPPTLADLASQFDMSARSLQRALKSEGTSVRAILDSARHAKALAFVAAGLPLAEIAYLLGYADQAAFHRAFRRWTGATPLGYRNAGFARSATQLAHNVNTLPIPRS